MKKSIVIMITLLLLILVGVGTFLFFKKQDNKENNNNNNIITQPKKENGYVIYNYEGKEYFVLENEYKGEYSIEYFKVSYDNSEEIDKFSTYSYEQYKNFCKKYNIEQKYNNENQNYLIYYYTVPMAYQIDTKLGYMEYDNDKLLLYIWDKVTYNGVMVAEEVTQAAYVVIVPTDKIINNYEVIPLIHNVEYNRMVGNNPLEGYNYTLEDNKKMVDNITINTDNESINDIINNSLKALSNKHTIKIDTYIDNEETKLISYMDLVNSVFKIQAGTKALHYIAYAKDMKIIYTSYGDGYYMYQDIVVDRDKMLYDVYSEFGNDFIENIDNYSINIKEDNDSFILEVEEINNLRNATYYINKDTYLIDKVIRDNRTNLFSYNEEKISLPKDINKITEPVTVDKPIIYLYPKQEMEITVKLINSDKITLSYPEYNSGWKVLASPNGNLIDLNTKRNLYSLYYESESIENFKVLNEGFVIKGENTIEFLEEKLAILGLNEREAEEFIIYWLPKLESNKYNYIRFATDKEINNNMPLEIEPYPDTIIRVLMTFKGLDTPIKVKEQNLINKTRQGYTVVEWGGTEIK